MMFDWDKIKQEDLIVLIRNTANKMKINDTVVEKDYWVCFVLDYLFHQSKWNKAFTFKGGTSLSKVFSSTYLTEAIRMGIGSLAAWIPSETAWIEPYIATEYPQIAEGKRFRLKLYRLNLDGIL